MNSTKRIFMCKSILGRKTKLTSEEVIRKCVELAYRDMLTAGRYYISKDMDTRCKGLITLLEKYQYQFSRELINETVSLFGDQETIGKGNKYVTRVGLAQKFVNMTFKYLYVFSDYTDKQINFIYCDCPLDSIILEKLPQIKQVWSKITLDEYITCQKFIATELKKMQLDDELQKLGNMAFDFYYW